jgi:CheY-like chemotaxis protein/anti-sigma regulatory factor (Ser/Thr protein kinase)
MPAVLVVDDSAVDRRLVGGLLKQSPGLAVEYAGNGAEAMEVLRWAVPDLVITDLQMPEMDGLALVRAMRAQYPRTPAILITGYGSEELAVQALEAGAVSYVPKSQLSDRLLPTVQQVLTVASEHAYEDLIRCLKKFDYTFELTNDPALIPPLVDLVQRFLASVGLCDATDTIRIGLSLEEAVRNALYHGNLELGAEAREAAWQRGGEAFERRRQQPPYDARRIRVDVHISLTEARFQVCDEGPGFDTADLAAHRDPARWDHAGRGYRLMCAFMDEVSYNAQGNEVILTKRLGRRSPPLPVTADFLGKGSIAPHDA